MKISKIKTLPILVLTLLFTANSYAQEATMQETEDWLNSKLTSVIFKRDMAGYAETTTQKVTVGDCGCTISKTETWGSNYPKGRVYEFDIRNVEYLHLPDIGDKDQVTTLRFMATGYVTYTYLLNGKFVRKEIEDSAGLGFQNQDLLARANKAFEHYIKLCKEKKEKF